MEKSNQMNNGIEYSKMMFDNYLNEVQSSKVLYDIPFIHTANADDISTILKNCSYHARKNFKICHNDICGLFTKINEIEKEMKVDTNIINNQFATYKDLWEKVFEIFNLKLLGIFSYAQETLIGSFREKVKRMDNFTICLFGRTTAGKSTTMEALTYGLGTAIGNGHKDYTQECKEYVWNELIVVDTPGIDSMFKRDELEQEALQYADKADLILLLLPHQILDEDLKSFKRFYQQNKPLFIILNIKKAVGEKGSFKFKDFIRNPEEVLNKKEVEGYKNRIKQYILDDLKIKTDIIPIIPVHSHSAFMSRHETDPEIKDKLYEISNFKILEQQLMKEVRERGEVYRIKNPYETIILFSQNIMESFSDFTKELELKRSIFIDNIQKFQTIRNKIIDKKEEIIKSSWISYIDSRKNAIQGIIQEIFDAGNDEEKRKKILSNFLSENILESKINKCQNEIKQEIEKEIHDFFKSFTTQINEFNTSTQNIQNTNATFRTRMKEIDTLSFTGNFLGRLSTLASITAGLGLTVVALDGAAILGGSLAFLGGSGTLFGLGAANIWNPVGWALIGASVIGGIWGMSKKKKMQDKIREAKKEAEVKITNDLINIKNGVESGLNRWVREILDAIQKNHIGVMVEYTKYSDKYVNKIKELNQSLENLIITKKKEKYSAILEKVLNISDISILNIIENDSEIKIDLLSFNKIDIETCVNILECSENKRIYIRRLNNE